jgi:hypothetical protein
MNTTKTATTQPEGANMNIDTILTKPYAERTEAEQTALENEVIRLARSLRRPGSRRLLRTLVNSPNEGLVRIEGTTRFKIRRPRPDGGAATVREFDNADLLPLLRGGLVTVQGTGTTVGIANTTPIAQGVANRAWR